MIPRKPIISVIGPNDAACTPEIEAFGEALGKALAEAGYVVCCGGLGGLMAAVCRGAKSCPSTFFGATIGILPGNDRGEANPWCDLVVPTGLGIARNLTVVRTGAAVVAVGGGAGTLSEIALAWQMGKMIVAVEGLGGWSEELAGRFLDQRRSEPIQSARKVEEVMAILACPDGA